MTDKTINDTDEIIDKIEEDPPERAKRLIAPGMEDALGGHTLGQYHLMARLGRGGMATVYKAYQPSLDRYVAVKVLSTFLVQDPDFVARFQREARAIAQLNHPNILPVHDYGQEGELIYIVMRYVEGGTLQEMMGQPLDLDTALEIIGQIGGALDYAHQRGIVHRDVKPGNVLMADGHWALLSDFGLARMIGASTRITQTGVGMGTPAYIAPEQAQGSGVDARSDLYSLGIILFEMLTGQVPFEGDTSLVVLLKHLKDPPPPPRQINPDIPEPVERVLLRALAKDPADRFQRAGDMVTALQQSATRGPGVTAAISLVPEERREQRNPVTLYAEAIGFLKAGEWQKALEKWGEVQAIAPDYPDTQEVAAKAKRELDKSKTAILPADLVPPMKEEAVPIWRKVPLWAWAAVGGAILVMVVAGATLPKAGSGFAAVSPTSVPVPATATLTPTIAVGATQTALAALAVEVMGTALAQASATVGASIPTPTDTPTPTQTPIPPTATATYMPAPLTPTLVPVVVPQPTGSITLTIYLRDTRTETGFAALSGDQRYGWMVYSEGKFVYGDAAVPIGDTVYHFDKPAVGPGAPEQLPDPWRVEFEFAEDLVAHTRNQAGFDSKKAQFWVGTLDDASAVGENSPYSLAMKLYEGNELRGDIQVFFTVADEVEGGVGAVVGVSEGEGGGPGGGGGGSGGGGGGSGKEPPGQSRDKDKDKGGGSKK